MRMCFFFKSIKKLVKHYKTYEYIKTRLKISRLVQKCCKKVNCTKGLFLLDNVVYFGNPDEKEIFYCMSDI